MVMIDPHDTCGNWGHQMLFDIILICDRRDFLPLQPFLIYRVYGLTINMFCMHRNDIEISNEQKFQHG